MGDAAFGQRLVQNRFVPVARCAEVEEAIRLRLTEVSEELDDYFAQAGVRNYTDRTVTDPAALRQVIAADRAQGWSWIQGELEEHICGLSVPVADHEGRTCAALNIRDNSLRMTKEIALETMLPRLQNAAAQLQRGLQLRAA